MIGSNAYNYINVLKKAADATFKRNEILSNNISNGDTPGFKRKDLVFEKYLMQELVDGDGNLDRRVANMNLANLGYTIYTDHEELSYRLDENNVDPEAEQARLAENQIKYYTLLDSMTQEFNRIKSVLNR